MSYPTYPVQAPVQPGGQASPAPAARRGWFAAGFAIVAAAFTVIATVLAALAPSLGASAPPSAPASWSKVYDATPSSLPDWTNGGGCTVLPSGLDAKGADTKAGTCLLAASTNRDLLSGGFLLQVRLAAAAQVPVSEDVYVGIGEAAAVVVTQAGDYILCNAECLQAPRSDPRSLGVSGTTFQWHGAFAPNTMVLRWAGGDAPLELFANGQPLATTTFSIAATDSENLWLGAPKLAEAVITHVTLYSATGA